MREWYCECCGRWRVSIELIRGRHRYRLAHRYRPEHGGGWNVLGEVAVVAELADLLHRHAGPDLADLREAELPEAG
ncbi:hypothetical protein AB0H57_01690 [Micromonospora sp. NPDC050686]|uniref:hypothetical protein n=1 Tax=Micromonospora sp. NPDC050686 TaxID=3154631 RepID=UPI0033D64E56